jgi:hypothetical protein
VQAAQKDAENEQKIAERKAELDRAAEKALANDQAMSKEALAEVVEENEDGDKAQRLYLAMQRTNALDFGCTFHFFRENFLILNSQQVQEATFPVSSLPPHGWVAAFEGTLRPIFPTSTLLTWRRFPTQRASFSHWLCAANISVPATPRGTSLLDGRPA